MDELIIAGIGLFILAGPWILLSRLGRKRKREREEDTARWRALSARVDALGEAVRQIRAERIPHQAEIKREEKAPVRVEEIRIPLVAPPVAPISPVQTANNWVMREEASAWNSEALGNEEPPLTDATLPPPVEKPPLSDRLRSWLDLEQALGTNWLNKLGIVILVLGVAFFLAYQLKTLGPAGKVLVGFLTSGVMLGLGIWFERASRYRILARAGVGGGWALLFFTTYAMYHVPAAQILTSQVVDLVLLLIIAAAMVLHTLRYRSQIVTGLAFLLAFLTVAISHSNVYSLSAGGVLAAGLVVIVLRMQWFELEVFGILASYLNHYLWLRPIIEPMHGHRHAFPEFPASAAMLLLYWSIFRFSYVFRKTIIKRQERISTAAALLNTALLLLLFKYQSTHPEWAFWALLAMGALEVSLGQLPATQRRRSAVIVLCTLGVILLIAAFPFRYSGMRLSLLWLVEAETLLLIGVWTKEIVFRRLGMIASLLVAGQMLSFDAAEIIGRRMDGADLRADLARAILFLASAAIFYANSLWIFRRWNATFTQKVDRRVMQLFSYAAALMLVAGAWIAFPESWTAVAWSTAGLVLAIGARRFASMRLSYQAAILGGMSVLRIFIINFEAGEKYHGVSLRLMTVALSSTLLYVTARWKWRGQATVALKQRSFPVADLVNATYTWAGSFLLALLAWYELRPVSVADAWAAGGLILLELGLTDKNVNLRLQGYTVLTASFLRIFFVNLNAAGDPGEISPRVYTVVPLALMFFYTHWRLRQSTEHELEGKFRAPQVLCWLGTISFASLMRFELEADWVAAAWAALVVALFAVAWRSRERTFLYQGMFLAVAVLFRISLHNFYERTYFPSSGWQSRWVTVGVGVGLLIAGLPFAFQLRRREQNGGTGIRYLMQQVLWRPEQLLFFIAIELLTVLLALEMRHGMVTLSWGLEGVAVFILALWLGERSFRLTGLALLLLCAAKILVVDVWRLDPRDRYLTLIVLGIALLLVSFLYTRNREALQQYL